LSGKGQRPQLTRICSRMAALRASHSLREEITGKSRGVFRVLTGGGFSGFAAARRSASCGKAERNKPVTSIVEERFDAKAENGMGED